MDTYLHTEHCRAIKDGSICWERALDDPVVRARTEQQVPVPSLRDARGQHIIARVVRRAGYISHSPYHPERRSTP